jgi:ribonuclease BN (tRNA processing enzyme)
MSALRLLPLGVGDAFSARYYSSCVALEADGAWLLIDCPHPIRKILREASATAGVTLDVEHLLAVVVTHLHADHSSGLEGLGFYAQYVLRRRMPLLVHPRVSARLWDGHLAAGMEAAMLKPGEPPAIRRLGDFFDLVALSDADAVQVGPFAVLCRPTIHTVPTTALQIRSLDRCLGYSADTAFDTDLIDWLAAADLIVHEAGAGLLHTPYDDLAGLPAALRKKMRLIHYPDTFDPEASVIEPLRQGRCELV